MGCLKLSYHSTGSPSVLRVVHSSYQDESVYEGKIVPLFQHVDAEKNDQKIGVDCYVFNNPLKYTDPDGEIAFVALIPILIKGAMIGAAIGGAGYTASVAFSDGGFNNWSWGGFGKAVGWGAVSGMATAGIGTAFGHTTGTFINEVGRALAHGTSNGIISELSGGNFATGFLSGGLGSLAGSGFQAWGGDFAKSGVGTIAFSAVAGGVGAELTGGNFWRGAATGATVAGLNHLGKRILSGVGDDDPKRKGGKGNTFRGGKQNQRDQDMKKYPKEFKDWYHKNAKDYKLPGQPDPNLGEPYQDWLDLGKPRAITTPTHDWNSFRNYVSEVTGLTGTALTIYLIISEGSRLFPPRNAVPIP